MGSRRVIGMPSLIAAPVPMWRDLRRPSIIRLLVLLLLL